ncbi:putative anti-sigma-YlaC factor YlaD [Mycobacterium sp. MAA66]|uniref:DUF6653 family protein n=1 Tax=Mycobacterium sp. MAA66 TaxID=3156297 RepID=UPI0035183954
MNRVSGATARRRDTFDAGDRGVGMVVRGIYGERLWLGDRAAMPTGFIVVQRIWIVCAIAGAGLLGWGLIALQLWPTIFGAVLIVYGQLWRIDRLGMYYDAVNARHE